VRYVAENCKPEISVHEERSLRRIVAVAAAVTSALLLAAATVAEPVDAGGGKDPARVAIDACHEAVERELLGKTPKGEQIAYEGDSIYRAAIEIVVNGSLRLSSGKGAAHNYDYTCRYNERSEQMYGVKLEKRK
jgi:hypothetical protein